jgi:hypothetical protein
MERTKRIKIEIERPVPMDIETRYKRKAEVLDEPIYLTPMQVDVRPPFIFYPMPRLVRADANAMD